MEGELIRPDFTDPWIRTASVVIPPQQDDEIDPSELEMALPFLLERIVVTENTIQDNAPPDPGLTYQGLGWLSGRWWTRGCQERSGPRMPLEIYNRARVQGQDNEPWMADFGRSWGQVAWDFRPGERPRIPVNGSVYANWSNVGCASLPGGFGPVTLTVGIIAIGSRTGKPTYLQIQTVFAQSPGGAPVGDPGIAGAAGGGAESVNRLEEDLLVDSISLSLNGRFNAWLIANSDDRVWSHLAVRVRIEPTGQALTPDGNPAPLLAYGQSRQILRRNTMICLRRSPVLLDTRDVIGFEFRNNAPVGGPNIRAIVSMVGRTPTRRECGM